MAISNHNNVAAFVLAGGASSRMGRDKALLELGGVPMVVRTTQLIEPYVASVAVVAPTERYRSLGLHIVADCWPGPGPLGGIVTALRVSSAEWNLILGCDLPYLTGEWIQWLILQAHESQAQPVVPESWRGLEPLAAIYHVNCAVALAAAFKRDVRRVTAALEEIVFEAVTPDPRLSRHSSDGLFRNMNTPRDFASAQRRTEMR